MSTYFISHSTQDRPFVESELIGLLSALGVKSWYCKEDITSGEQWERSIKNALEDCDGLILVMSPESEQSEWVKDELNWGINNKPGRVIPILYKPCILENFHIRIPRIQFADYTLDVIVARNKLIKFLINTEHEANSRIKAMNGLWKGIVRQSNYVNSDPLDYPVEVLVRVSDKVDFSGSVTIYPPGGEIYFRLLGGFLYEKFIQFSYRSTDPGVIQFGSAVLELNSQGNYLNGKFVGYGANSQSIVDGTVNMKKIQP